MAEIIGTKIIGAEIIGSQAVGEGILARRLAFNAALARHDLTAMAEVLDPKALLITGDDNQLIDGREAQIEAWRSIFLANPDTVFERVPERITTAQGLPLASEIGTWQGRWSERGAPKSARGAYHAKWKRRGKIWVIDAESFITLVRD
ncbi:nuclear transport factor 2 family protein [Woodsholea maritima]|uniref:nuclear transport factor 2 family protein n=1 Tax=Woodsholea maritima TaxID=240237 RepID=UPI000381C830|nr:nuclear transport factor 2 family protein [Woodsholea maritima]